MQPKFIHLHLHTEYSLIDGIVRVKPLFKYLKDNNIPAVAMTDYNNVFAMVKFYKTALSMGVKPIIGAEIQIKRPNSDPTPLVLLCKNIRGYNKLCEILTKGYLEQDEHGVVIHAAWLNPENCTDLIALSGGTKGDIGQLILKEHSKQAKSLIKEYSTLFPKSFYLEIHRIGNEGEEEYIQEIMQISSELQIPLVATNKVCFLDKEDFQAHEVRVCIYEGYVLEDKKRPKKHTEQQYLRSVEEMEVLFSDIPEALQNSIEIAKRCNVQLTLGKYVLPQFPTPEGMGLEDYLKQQAELGLEERFALIGKLKDEEKQFYIQRLHHELEVINTMGFPGYFLIVADFIQWAKDQKPPIPVGPGRGSGAGSLVAYALKITELNPIPYDLLFERFLNPERVSMPDFDIDFCMERRDEVIDYVAQYYGRNQVSQIITYGTMAARAVVRDVGRVFSLSYGFCDKIAKLIPGKPGTKLNDAFEQEPELVNLYETDEEVKNLLDTAKKLEGIPRNAGKHAGGVVIAPTPLTEFAPLYCEQGAESIVTQFDKDDIEALGLVKFDFLGLRTLTIIDWALFNLKKVQGITIDIDAIPLNDSPSFELLRSGYTTAVFQLESHGMQELIRNLKPDVFEDLIALVALYRPGPLKSGMVTDFIKRKHGEEPVTYPHPSLEGILAPTYGIIVYQEQVMQIAQVLADYTLGGADLLRRAMGKKKMEEMAKQRVTFVDGAKNKAIDEKISTEIFDTMEKFAEYGFNKSHSAAYALVSYQTAYLKAHYPAAFMAAVLSSEVDDTDKLVHLLAECKRMQLKILAPDVNYSQYMFEQVDESSIRYALGAVKGVGFTAVKSIIKGREEGPYQDLYDFCMRVDLQKVNNRVLEALIKSGSLDGLDNNRARLQKNLENTLKRCERKLQSGLGQNELFAFETEEKTQNIEEMPLKIKAQGEKATLGFYFSCHPLNEYQAELEALGAKSLVLAKNMDFERSITVGVWLNNVKYKTSERGKDAILFLEDSLTELEMRLFNKEVEKFQAVLEPEQPVIIKITKHTNTEGKTRLRIKDIKTFIQTRQELSSHLKLLLYPNHMDKIVQIQEILKHYPGEKSIIFYYHMPNAKIKLKPASQWKISLENDLFSDLESILGKEGVCCVYPKSYI